MLFKREVEWSSPAPNMGRGEMLRKMLVSIWKRELGKITTNCFSDLSSDK